MKNPEFLGVLESAWEEDGLFGLLSMAFLSALTDKQRNAIKERDSNCQAPFPHECKGREEIHHIVPQRWAYGVLGWDREVTDDPSNLILLCANAHTYLHPDRATALSRWRRKGNQEQGDRDPFREMQENRDRMVERKKKYWYSEFDALLSIIARELTETAKKRGWTWPRVKEKKKKAA